MTTEFTYIETIVSSKVCYWTWLFHSNGLWAFWVQDILLMMFLQNTFIIKKVTNMPAVTIQLYEQRLNFFNVWPYHWHQVFLIDQHLFHLFVTTPWHFFKPHLPIFSPHGSVWPNLGFHVWMLAQFILTIMISSGMVMWFKLFRWYLTLGVLLSCGRGEAEKLFTEVD